MRSNSKIKSKEILINILTGKSYTVKELDKIHYIQKDLRYLKRASIISTTIGKTKKRVLRYKLINKAQLNEYIEYEYGNIIKHTDGEYTKAAAAKETGNAHSGKSHNSQFFQLIAFNNIDLLNQRNNKVINASSLWAEHKISCCVTGSTACDIRIKKVN